MSHLSRRTACLALPALVSAGHGRAQTGPRPIAELIAGDPQFQTFTAWLQRAGLLDGLRTVGPFTVFAPTNAAFDLMPSGLREALNPSGGRETSTDMVRLPAVMSSHIVAGRLSTAEISGRRYTVQNSNGGTITLEREGERGLVASLSGGGFGAGGLNVQAPARVGAELLASNGSLFPVDAVLLP
jgi:uncharacterized surface protein with fasciclin (FAS1) repeats